MLSVGRIVAGLAVVVLLVAACGDDEPESTGTTTTALSTTTVQATTSSAPTGPTSKPPPATSDTRTSTSEESASSSTAISESGLIAYWRSRELWLMDADGANQRLVPTGVVLESGPDWSPDGTELAFTGWDPEGSDPGGVIDVWLIDADGGEPSNVTSLPGTDSVASFSWSPNGTQFVYATTEWDLWTINVDGTGRQRITDDEAHQNLPAWSPDGSSIVYELIPVVDRVISGDTDLWVSATDGSNPRQLTDLGSATEPAWSPDATRLAFVNYVFAEHAEDDHSNVWVINSDGSGPRNLTNEPTR